MKKKKNIYKSVYIYKKFNIYKNTNIFRSNKIYKISWKSWNYLNYVVEKRCLAVKNYNNEEKLYK